MKSFIMIIGFKSVNIICGLIDIETCDTKVKMWIAKLPIGEKEGKSLTLMNIRNATQRKTLLQGAAASDGATRIPLAPEWSTSI